MANRQEMATPRHFATHDWKQVGVRVKGEVSRDNLSVIAAGVAFYAFFALFPALAAMVSLYGLIADPADVSKLVESMQGVLPGQVTGIVSNQLQQVAAGSSGQLGWGVAAGLLIALWSANKGTKSLVTALNIAYEEEEDRGFFRLNAVTLLLTFGAIISVIIAVAGVVAAPALLKALNLPDAVGTAINWLRWPLLALLMAVGLALFYRYAPSRQPADWSWLSYGSVVATLLWLIASGLFSWYVSNFGSYNETYGSMAAIAILLMWFYISAYVILLGAELNSEMEYQTRHDTTTGPAQPEGRRGAAKADSSVDEERDFRA
jgi:membrane protein